MAGNQITDQLIQDAPDVETRGLLSRKPKTSKKKSYCCWLHVFHMRVSSFDGRSLLAVRSFTYELKTIRMSVPGRPHKVPAAASGETGRQTLQMTVLAKLQLSSSPPPG